MVFYTTPNPLYHTATSHKLDLDSSTPGYFVIANMLKIRIIKDAKEAL